MTTTIRAGAAALALACGCGEDDPESGGLPAPKGGAYGPDIALTSTAFADGEVIPDRYTCNGDGVSPPLSWANVPAGTKSFAIVVDDPDAAKKVFVHWVAWAIAGDETMLIESIAPVDEDFVQGRNDTGDAGYAPPCPPSDDEPHRYEHHIFAVDFVPNLPLETTRDELYRRLDGRVLAKGELVGLFGR
ncbi:MAG TPA: YbhB/YbcL family Raf kinase inhibitor-like protein [Nannocystaceae bacterium]|nr:YbhB/YbcL family Raf kinase inhibitor-like protein [Nannocystaceae bacterium]